MRSQEPIKRSTKQKIVVETEYVKVYFILVCVCLKYNLGIIGRVDNDKQY